jgi:CHAT domain-containing protein
MGLPSEEYVARRFEALSLEHIPGADATLKAVRRRAETLLHTLTTALSSPVSEAFLVNKWSQRDAEIADVATRLLNERAGWTARRGIGRWIAAIGWSARVAALHHYLIGGTSDSPADVTRSRVASALALWRLVRSSRREQAINFAVLANGVVLLTLRWCHCDLQWTPLARGAVRSLMRRFHEQLALGDSEREVERAATDLAGAVGLRRQLDELPSRISRLKVYPDDQLHGFPFAVVRIDGDRQVVDQWAVTIGIRRPEKRHSSVTPRRAVVAATSGGSARPPLREASSQAAWLADWWRARGVEVTVLPEGSCGADELTAALSSNRFVHFSGHGVFDPHLPARTGIAVDGREAAGAVLDLAALAAVDCRSLRFATFLSCWSADSFLFPGRWSVSIPSTLCRAGAAAVVAPLWEIEDAISSELLKGLYEQLTHQRADEALRQSQLSARAAPSGERRDSFFWAALQLYGDGAGLAIR